MSLPLKRSTVRQHVGFALRDVLINCTDSISQENYHPGLVPSKAPPEGFGMDLANWDRKLVRIQGYLWNMNPTYKVLNVTPSDSQFTLSKALRVTSDLLTDNIIASHNQE